MTKRKKDSREGLCTESVHALQTTVNVTVTSEELTCLTNPSRHKDKEDSPRQDSDQQEEILNKTQLSKQEETNH